MTTCRLCGGEAVPQYHLESPLTVADPSKGRCTYALLRCPGCGTGKIVYLEELQCESK